MKDLFKNKGTIEDRFMEECGECLQALSKVKRFGIKNFHPDRPDSNNGYELLNELRDLVIASHNLEAKIEYDLRELD